MTFFDGLALILLVVSALIGFFRGGAREVVSAFSFLLAGLVSLLALPVTGRIGRALLDPDWAGTVAAVVVVFVFVGLILRLVAGWLSRSLQEHDHLGGADRMAGLGFGVLRALLLLGIIHLALYAATPAGRIPHWYRDAKAYPAARASARVLQLVLPTWAKAADAVAPAVERSVRSGATDQPQSGAKAPAHR
ncbi:MAG: CvpA family protein [Caulobacteraceae bacterium]|nr:CvpA family protein [Caulobacteraceae bacterium]